MTKILFSISAVLSTLIFGQQTISFESSEGYNLGSVVGQKEWSVKTDNVPNSNFKVVTGKASDGNNSVEEPAPINTLKTSHFFSKKSRNIIVFLFQQM